MLRITELFNQKGFLEPNHPISLKLRKLMYRKGQVISPRSQSWLSVSGIEPNIFLTIPGCLSLVTNILLKNIFRVNDHVW